MILSNVNIGTGPSSGDGSPLRSAFSIINNNFQLITNNVNALSNSVSSVAGRTGNVILTINDILGINVYATNASVDSKIAANIANVGGGGSTYSNVNVAAYLTVNGYATTVYVDTANTSVKNYVDGQIIAANAGVTAANVGMQGYVDNAVTTANIGMKGYVDNAVATSGYSNVQVATYLPTYTGNIAAGNVRVSSGYRFETGNVRITNDNSSVTLTPDTSANALAGVAIGGNGYLLAPNNARNITLNYNSVNGAVGLQANVTVGTGGSGNLFVQGNVIARDITAGNIIATGTSGVIGFNSGGFVQQATSNANGVTSNTTSGNIQLMSIDLGAFAAHTVAFSCNKLTTNDILLVKHVSGGVTSVVVDAYVATDGLAVIWLRDITGNGTGAITPMLKYAIIRAPSA